MIFDNDIYIRSSPNAPDEYRLTDNGQPGIIYNGVPDWLYQEEILFKPEAIWASTAGTHLLYASFNDSKVTELEFPWFGGFSNSINSSPRKGVFPPTRSVRYPTPGSPNPEVDLWLVDFTNTTSAYVNSSSNATIYLPARTRLKPPSDLDGL